MAAAIIGTGLNGMYPKMSYRLRQSVQGIGKFRVIGSSRIYHSCTGVMPELYRNCAGVVV